MEKSVRQLFGIDTMKTCPHRGVVRFFSGVDSFFKGDFCVEEVDGCGVEVQKKWRNLWNGKNCYIRKLYFQEIGQS